MQILFVLELVIVQVSAELLRVLSGPVLSVMVAVCPLAGAVFALQLKLLAVFVTKIGACAILSELLPPLGFM